MAVFQRLKELFIPTDFDFQETDVIIPAPETTYRIKPMTIDNLKEVLLLNLRCFKRGENYTKYTFKHLLTAPNILGYRIVNPQDEIVGFIFVSANNGSVGHITTIGVSPEHRKRGLARELLNHVENALRRRDFEAIVLEVRVSNFAAQNLYSKYGYVIIQKLIRYYHNGEDAYLMSKTL